MRQDICVLQEPFTVTLRMVPRVVVSLLIPRSFGHDGHKSKQWARRISLYLHKNQWRRFAGAPESARLRTLSPNITKLHNGKLNGRAREKQRDMLHISAIDPDIDVLEVSRGRVDDLQVEFLRDRLDLNHIRLRERFGIGAGRQGWVVEIWIARREHRRGRASEDQSGAKHGE